MNRILTVFLILFFLIYSWSYIVSPTIVYAEQKKKTIFTPKTKEPPAEKGIEAPKKGVSGWWYVLGIVVIGSAAAASAASSQAREKKRPTLE